MKNEKENSRKQEGFLWITLGLLLIAAALFITAGKPNSETVMVTSQ